MKIQSCKRKGRELVKKVRAMLLEAFPSVSESDIKIPTTSCPGEDLWLSDHARNWFPFSLEMKNQERLNVYSAYAQAVRNSSHHTPALVFSRNREDIYIMLKLKDFIYSLKEDV